MGVGGYQGQEQLSSPTPAVPSEGKQQGSRWAISGRILAATATASQLLNKARDVLAAGVKGGGRRYCAHKEGRLCNAVLNSSTNNLRDLGAQVQAHINGNPTWVMNGPRGVL